MRVPIPLNDLDKAIMAFQRGKAAVPDLLRHLCADNLERGESHNKFRTMTVPSHSNIKAAGGRWRL